MWDFPLDAAAEVCPRFMPNYASMFYVGLRRFVRSDRIVYDRTGFTPERLRQLRGFSVTVRAGGLEKRLHYDLHDPKECDAKMLEWCDVYAKVNVDWSVIPEHLRHKVIPVGPLFGVRIWDTHETIRQAWTTLRALGPYPPRLQLGHLKLYRLQLERGFEDWYSPGPTDPDYVFFTAWAWAKHAEVNPPRAEFVRIAQTTPGLVFDGGFAPRRRGKLPNLKDVTAPSKFRFYDYLTRMKRSCVAFNTPAVHQCLGWKMGEFLALGKATISLPLTGELPEPLVHGEHMHFVSGEPEETRDALAKLRTDHAYRRKLEQNARNYYERLLSPPAMVGRVLRFAGW
jgi:hypothetical protein